MQKLTHIIPIRYSYDRRVHIHGSMRDVEPRGGSCLNNKKSGVDTAPIHGNYL